MTHLGRWVGLEQAVRSTEYLVRIACTAKTMDPGVFTCRRVFPQYPRLSCHHLGWQSHVKIWVGSDAFGQSGAG